MGRVQYRAKSLLCCLLVVQLHILPAACSLPGLPGPDGWLTVPIVAGGELDAALKGSAFESATALAVNVWTHQFRLTSPGGGHELSGAVADSSFGSMVQTIRVSDGSGWAEATFDTDAKLSLLKTSAGNSWQRPADWTSAASDDEASLHDAMMNANAELVIAAQALDAMVDHPVGVDGSDANGGAGSPTAKSSPREQAINGDLSGALGVLALLAGIGFIAANFPVVYFLIQIAVSLSLTISLLNLAPGTAPSTNGGAQTPTNNTGGNGQTVTPTTGGATLRVSNVLDNNVPIWYVVPLPLAGEQPVGNLLGDEAIPAGATRDFVVPTGTRGVNIIVPTDNDCLRVYQWNGVLLLNGEVTELVQSSQMTGSLFPSDCGG